MIDYKLHNSMAKPEDSVLLVIDVQDRLIGTISRKDNIVKNIGSLVKTAQVYHIPILLTEQGKLGVTVPQIKELLDKDNFYNPITKLSFSCYGNEDFRKKLVGTGRKKVLITGIETHICVAQTALELLANDYLVQVIVDATSSHTREDYKTAIDMLRMEGATITTTEALMYALTNTAERPEFKQILAITKDRRGSLGK